MKIVIADDSKLMRDRIREAISIFKKASIVAEAETGKDALEALRQHSPDLAILDVRMPEMNGLEVLKAYRASSSETKIMILTNYAYDQYRDRALQYGADYFYSKSDDFDKIMAVVAGLIRNGSE